MCGIGGMAGPAADAAVVGRMTAALHHRGPDGHGAWSGAGVALGHRRLKIIDLSDAGRQPMTTPDGRYTIVYNGEVYNFAELRRALPHIHFRSGTDTEVVLRAYERWGPACLERFVGMYALAIWDARERTLFCARDRLGIKPFYYAQVGGTFCFASEIRALLAAGAPRAVNETVLYDFLARDFYEHTDQTFFAGISKLPPASWALVRNGRMGPIRRYWSLAASADALVVAPNAAQRDEALLARCTTAVQSHLVSDVPVGVALSGGLDSATLLALLDRTHPDPTKVEAFSVSYPDATYSERPYVEAMAQATGRQAHFVEVTAPQFAEVAERCALEQEEPYAGLPIAGYGLGFALARELGFIVVMDGSGIDEGLAGYDRFRPARWADLQRGGVAAQAQLQRELEAAGVNTPAAVTRAREQMRAAADPEGDVGKGQDLTTSVRPDCLASDFAQVAAAPTPAFERPFADCLRNLMYRELRYTKLPRALRFRDRLSMAVGCELRPPFLDHRLLAYEFALPPDDLIAGGVSKVALRRAAARLLPEATRLASKRSVQTPQREWFRGPLKEWIRERIDTPSFWSRGWVDRPRALAALDAFQRGEGDNSFFLWQWANLEMWAQEFLDQHPPVHKGDGDRAAVRREVAPGAAAVASPIR
jgi:asparagine synthase (glutamine-hydrolysing)